MAMLVKVRVAAAREIAHERSDAECLGRRSLRRCHFVFQRTASRAESLGLQATAVGRPVSAIPANIRVPPKAVVEASAGFVRPLMERNDSGIRIQVAGAGPD